MEDTADGKIGYAGELREVFSGLRKASCGGHIVQITEAGLDGNV